MDDDALGPIPRTRFRAYTDAELQGLIEILLYQREWAAATGSSGTAAHLQTLLLVACETRDERREAARAFFDVVTPVAELIPDDDDPRIVGRMP